MARILRSDLEKAFPDPQERAEAERRFLKEGDQIVDQVPVTAPPQDQPIASPAYSPTQILNSAINNYTAGDIKVPWPMTAKILQDTAFGTLGGAVGSLVPIPGAPAAGAAGGQYVSDLIAGTPGQETARNALLAGAIPGGFELGTHAAAMIPSITPYAVRQAIAKGMQSPLGLAALRYTRPILGLGKGAETNLGDQISQSVAAEMSPETAGPIAQEQMQNLRNIKARAAGPYVGPTGKSTLVKIDQHALADEIRSGFKSAYQKGSKAMATPEMDTVRDVYKDLANRIEFLGNKKGYLDMEDLEVSLDQIRDAVGANFDVPGGSLKIQAYKDVQGKLRKALADSIPDPHNRALFEEEMSKIEGRLDARDSLRSELSREVVLDSGETYKGAEGLVRSVDSGTARGNLLDRILQDYDKAHGTDFYWQARRLKIMRSWSPDERTAATRMFGIWRQWAAGPARLGAKLGASAVGASAQVLPTARAAVLGD